MVADKASRNSSTAQIAGFGEPLTGFDHVMLAVERWLTVPAPRGPAYAGPHLEGTAHEPHPDAHLLRRYFARHLDMVISSFVIVNIFWFGFFGQAAIERALPTVVGGNIYWRIVCLTIIAAASAMLNAFLIGLTGSSIGKFIFGIRVTNADGSTIGIFRALRREVLVWSRGLAFGIPLISFLTQVCAGDRLNRDGGTYWDEVLETRVLHRPSAPRQMYLNFGGAILWIVLTAVSLVSLILAAR